MSKILKSIFNTIVKARKARAEREIRMFFQTEYGRDYRNYVKSFGCEPTVSEMCSIIGNKKFHD